MDITFREKEGTFNFRVCGILIHEGKLLAMHDENSPYYYLPGGRVQLHEPTEVSVIRELEEELGIKAKIIRPLWLDQNFFTEVVNGQRYHEICVYYLIDFTESDLLSRGNEFVIHEGHKTLVFEWLEFDRVKSEYLFPLFIKDAIFNIPEHLTLVTEIH